MLSGYKTMWMIVMFDIPVASKKQQKSATKFRQFLINEGLFMKQFSVYMKYFDSKEKAVASSHRIRKQIPEDGLVSIFYITDKQFGQVQNFVGKKANSVEKKPPQLQLF